MKVLSSAESTYNLDRYTEDTKDNIYYCVYDISDPNNTDYYFKKMSIYQTFSYPAVTLEIGGKYEVDIPLSWKTFSVYIDNSDAELVDIEEFLNFDYQVLIFNPFRSFVPRFMDAKITKVYNSDIKWYVPKLSKKNYMVLPLGEEKDWTEVKRENNQGLHYERYPECIIVADETEKLKKPISLGAII